MKWYKCDPEKNVQCKKRTCVYNTSAENKVCFKTSNPAFAVLDETMKPMEIQEKPDEKASKANSQGEKKAKFHERFWWLPALLMAVSLIADIVMPMLR